MYKHLLVVLDSRPESEQALKQAIALAKVSGAALTGISVIEKLPAYAASVGEVEEVKSEFEKFFARLHENAIQTAKNSGVAMKTALRAGNAAQTVVRYANEHAVDLIVIGAEQQHALSGTADKISEQAACSVLLARLSLPSIRVKEVMTREVVTIAPDTPLEQVVELLVEKGLKAAPVVQDGRVLGIVTGGDLLARAAMGLRISLQRALPADVFSGQLEQLAAEGKTAADIMSAPPVTIGEDELVTRAAALMAEKNIKRLPVLDREGKLAGIISRLDVLALVSSGSPSSNLFPAVSGASPRTAGDIMFRDVPTVAPDAPLNEVINKILATPLRRVVVSDEERRVLGIIVDADLLRAKPAKTGGLQSLLARFTHAPSPLPSLNETAAEVMNREVFSVLPDTPLGDVVRLMIERRIKRLVVTDEQRRLLGMVSRESILRALLRQS